MKGILSSLFLLIAVSGCVNKNGDKEKEYARKELLKEITELRKIVAAKDSVEMRKIISTDMLKGAYIENYAVVFDEFASMFNSLDISKLAKADTINTAVSGKNEPCMTKYSIETEGDSLATFEFRMEVNPNYKLTNKNIEEDLDASSLCEHISWWKFCLKNNRLKLVSIDGAD